MSKAVIFIPGIKGSKMYDANTIDNEVLWQDIRFNFEDFPRLALTEAINDKHYDSFFDTIVAPLQLEPLAYKEFWRKLSPNYKWKFLFPYDWRLPNEVNADRLNEFVLYIMEKSKALVQAGVEGVSEVTQVDFVTHSMGNHALRFYIGKYGFSKINKVVFTVPPFLGAANSISAFVVGQGFFFNHSDARKMARTLPAIFELLPRYKYTNQELQSGIQKDLFDPKNWQSNMVDKTETAKDKTKELFIKNILRAKEALERLDNWMEDLTEDQKKRIMVLAKTDYDTFTSLLIEENPNDGKLKNYFNLGDSLSVPYGDGVVPDASSCCYYDQLTTYAVYNETFRNDKSHAFVLSDERVQRIINGFLNNKEDATQFDINLIGRSVKKVTGFTEENEDGFAYERVKH